MGVFHVKACLSHPRHPHREKTLSLLVDTGATDTILPGAVVNALQVRPIGEEDYELADGRIVSYQVGEVAIELMGKRRTVLVAFGRDGEEALLGATALEVLGFGVDPVRRRLVPVKRLLK